MWDTLTRGNFFMKKSIIKFLNSGFSLIEVTVAMGILGGVFVASMQLAKNSATANKSSKNSVAKAIVFNNIRKLLINEPNCVATIANLTNNTLPVLATDLPSQPPPQDYLEYINIPEVKSDSGYIFYKTNSTYSKYITIDNFRVVDKNMPDLGTAGLGQIYFQIYYTTYIEEPGNLL